MTNSVVNDTDGRKAGLKQLLGLSRFLAPYRGRVIWAMFFLLLAAGSVLWVGQGLRGVVDKGLGVGQVGGLDGQLLTMFWIISILAIATAMRFYLVSWIGERIAADIRMAVFSHVLTLDAAFFERSRVGELQSRIMTDTTLLESIFGSSFSIAIRNVLLAVGSVLLLLFTSPKLAGMVFMGVPLVLGPVLFYGRRVKRLSRISQDRLADISSYVDEALHGIRTVQAFTHESQDRQRFTQTVNQAFSSAINRIHQRAQMTGAVIFLVFAAVGLILWVGGHDVIAGRMTGGQLSAFVFYAILLASSVGAISQVAGEVMRAAGAAERLLELLSIQTDIRVPDSPETLAEPVQGTITFDGVEFAYPGHLDSPVLHSIHLQIPAGQTWAFVGHSGAGKSTLFQLLLRFYDPLVGAIRIDGVPIQRLAPEELRQTISWVSQESVIFATDVWDNIAYSRPQASKKEIEAAAKAAYATEFIDRLPQGWETQLGERGVKLSGGQKQRIAIARAILRNARILLLDEATSALDSESERAVQLALENLMEGKTTLVIAHRLATVLKADKIVVLEAGEIRGVGTHQELLKNNALYTSLAKLQFND